MGRRHRSFTFELRGPLAGGVERHGRHRPLQRGRGPAQADHHRGAAPDGSVRFLAHAKMGPVRAGMGRPALQLGARALVRASPSFTRGPFARPRCALRADGRAARAAAATIACEAAPRGLLGRLVLAGGFLRGAERMFTRLAAQADRFATGAQPMPFAAPAAPLRPEALATARADHAAAGRQPLWPWPGRAACRACRRGARGRCRADPPLALARRGACPSGTRSRHAWRPPAWACWSCAGTCSARAAAAPRPPPAPRPAADRGALRHLQHRLWPRLLAQCRADLPPGGQHPTDRERRVLPARADEHATHLGAHHPRARRGAAGRVHRARGPLSAAHAGDRAGGRHRA